MPNSKPYSEAVRESRITEEYLVSQVQASRLADTWTEHKNRIANFDSLYRGDFKGLFPDESSLPNQPLVENKAKNALHDLARLASEAKGMPSFPSIGDSIAAATEARLREGIADTLWRKANGRRMERKLYMDLLVGGFASLAVYFNEKSDYPQVMRLDPRMAYPDARDGVLDNMLYVETMPLRQAAMFWPEIEIPADSDEQGLLVTFYDDYEVCQAIMATAKGKLNADRVWKVKEWEHKLGIVPVAFEALDTADSTYHGVFDQLGGTLMARNKTVRLLVDYLEQMAHAPLEEKNIMEPIDDPGPLTLWHHDPNADESFIRRVAPATPANAVFGLLQYMESQEAVESIQPPSRVGQVSQSIASASFVSSTQGTLSSAVMELQDLMGSLRKQFGRIAMAIEEKHLNFSKPLWNAVGNRRTYKPTVALNGNYDHEIVYGATAGLRPMEADVRVLQHLGAGLISKETAREQIDYVADVTSEQDKIDREQLAMVLFQRFGADPNAPLGLIAQVFLDMSEGKSLIEALEKIAPALVEYQAQQQAAEGLQAAAPAGPGPMEEQMALEKGQTQGVPGGAPQGFEPTFAPPPLQQQIVRTPGA